MSNERIEPHEVDELERLDEWLSEPPWEVKQTPEGGFTFGTIGNPGDPDAHSEIRELEIEQTLEALSKIRNLLPKIVRGLRENQNG